MSSTVIFLDEEGRVLVLETTYKPNWELPGGGRYGLLLSKS